MPSLKDKADALLGSTSGVDMKTAASTAIFTVPVGKTCRISHVVVRDTSASLARGAGASSYGVTNWRSGVSLVSMTTAGTDYMYIDGADVTKYTELAAGTVVYWIVTTGCDAVCTATIDIFGYLT
jgi:hypothetical protein